MNASNVLFCIEKGAYLQKIENSIFESLYYQNTKFYSGTDKNQILKKLKEKKWSSVLVSG